MSSSFLCPPALLVSSTSTSSSNGFDASLRTYTKDSKPGQLVGTHGGTEIDFKSGLPTPPGSRAMTSIGLDHSRLNHLIPNQDYNSQLSHRGPPSSNSLQPLRCLELVDGNDQFRSSAADYPIFWSAGRDDDNGNRPANASHADSDIAPHLQIPSSINNSRGSLAEFTAEMTCLFWFESAATLQRAEETPTGWSNHAVMPLATDARPTVGFLKWVTTIWSTTQVAQNVILLALLFVRRLKKFNPGVSGKKGSEYRLLTIALMLGNKFLDDNTYTNKTWAEVSGISVTEIHIMEVEFLSNMRYNLYVSEQEWKNWLVKLGRLTSYFHQASKALPVVELSRPQPVIPSINQTFSYRLPSPPSPARHAPSHPMQQPTLPHPLALGPRVSTSPTPPTTEPEHILGRRKRSADVSADVPFAKRFSSNRPSSQSSGLPAPTAHWHYTPSANTSSSASADPQKSALPLPRLPVPHVSSMSAPAADGRPGHSCPTPLSIPPSRAMAMVYPTKKATTTTTTPNWSDPVTPTRTMPSASVNPYANPMANLGEQSSTHYASTNAAQSPAGYGPTTPCYNSPLSVLSHRNSPYRPVRGVNTLLIPPPSTSFHDSIRNISLDQMRYQPLGKTLTEARPGVVPYMHYDTWSQPWTPAPVMPAQSIFHA